MTAQNHGKTAKPKGRARGRPFGPNNRGNPGGRPKIPEDIKKGFRERTKAALEALDRAMLEGGAVAVRAAEVILDRAWGKPRQEIEVDAKVDAEVKQKSDISKLTNDELRQIVAIYETAEARDISDSAK